MKAKWNILLVEDNEDLAEMWADAFSLAAEEFALAQAGNGREALKVLALSPTSAKIDLIVTDLNMPQMGGLELMDRVAESHPQMAFIVVTAQGDKETIKRCLRVGAVEFLEKPVSPLELMNTIRRVLATGRQPGPVAELRRLHREMQGLVSQEVEKQRAEIVSWIRGGINHRFNQPLQVLFANTRLLEKILEKTPPPGDFDQMSRDCLHDIANAGHCIADLLQLLIKLQGLTPEPYVGGDQILSLEKSACPDPQS